MKNFLLALAFISLFFSYGLLAQVNNCLDFDGADDYVTLALNNNLSGRTQFTIEMWTSAAELSGGQTFFAQKNDNDNRIHIQDYDLGTGRIAVFVCNGSNSYGYTNSVVITTGKWFHLAMVFDGTQTGNENRLKFYINGDQVALTFSGTIPAVAPTLTADALLGVEIVGLPYNYFRGKMDEARIWYTAARTEDEIKKYMNTTLGTRSNLLASYHFDEGTAGGNNAGITTLNDKSGATNHFGTLLNFALSGTTSNWVSRVYPTSEDNCLKFDGTNDYINLAGLGGEIDDKTALTIEMWVNAATLTDYATLFSKYYSDESRTQIQLRSTGDLLLTIEQASTAGTSQAYTTSAPVTTGNWFHLAMVYDGVGSGDVDKLKLYINGQQVALTYSGTINTDLNNTSMPALLGAQGAGLAGSLTNYLNGKMDEVKIWNVARTQENIQNYMLTALVGNEAGLVSYQSFNQGTASGSNSGVLVLNDLSFESDWNSGTAAKHFGVLTNLALTGSTSNWIELKNAVIPSGSGTIADPYLISNLDELNWIASDATRWNKYYRQTSNIDATITGLWNSGAGWLPIGDGTTQFTGTYNGNSKTISGLYINRIVNYQGLFGRTNAATISNLGLIAVNINAGSMSGGLAGETVSTTISNCYSTGAVIGVQYFGGLFGYFGGNVSSSFSNCTVIGVSRCGGFIGHVAGTVQNCYSTGNVTRKTGASSTDLGGFAGIVPGASTISNCYSTGRVIYAGTTDPTNKGFVGENTSGIYSNNFWDTETSLQTTTAGTATGKTTAEMKTNSTFLSAGWDYTIWNIGDGINNGYPYLKWQNPTGTPLTNIALPVGAGTVGDPYEIATLQNLTWIAATDADVPSPNQAIRWAAYYIQTANIDASSTSTWNTGAGWSPIGNSTIRFSGTYDGDGHTISGLYINRSSSDYQSFIGFTNTNTVIKNLGLLNVNFTGHWHVGGLVACPAFSTISKCFTTGSVSGSDNFVGGLFGYSHITNTDNCYTTASVTGTGIADYIGGAIGYLNGGTLVKSYSTGVVTGTSSNVGGLVSYGSGTVTGSFWDTQSSGKATSFLGTAKTTAEMKTNTTFLSAGWDDTIWNIGDGINDGYPYLDWQNPSGTPLPVELSSFSATTAGSKVNLSWCTATEVNNYGFEVLRQAQDDKEWAKIGFVNGNGNSNSTKSYSYEDKNVTIGKYSYRLKQIDNDGHFEYSKTIEVDMVGVKKFELSQNYPNPFNPATTIQYSLLQTGLVRLILYNILGQEIRTLVNEVKEAGTHTINFDASDLNSGMYIYKIESGSFTQTKKMTLVK